MLPKARFTSHSRMSGSRWVTTPSWLPRSLRPFLYSSLCSCHVFLISSVLVMSLLFLSFIVPIFAWNVPLVSNFLGEISCLSHSIVFLYFFALCTQLWYNTASSEDSSVESSLDSFNSLWSIWTVDYYFLATVGATCLASLPGVMLAIADTSFAAAEFCIPWKGCSFLLLMQIWLIKSHFFLFL